MPKDFVAMAAKDAHEQAFFILQYAQLKAWDFLTKLRLLLKPCHFAISGSVNRNLNDIAL